MLKKVYFDESTKDRYRMLCYKLGEDDVIQELTRTLKRKNIRIEDEEYVSYMTAYYIKELYELYFEPLKK